MSDGDNATPGLPSPPGPAGPGGDNPWLTRNPRPSPVAAQWERSGSSEPEGVEKAGQQPGNHADQVTVADLIAKVHGKAKVPDELRHTEIIAAVSEPPTRYSPVSEPDNRTARLHAFPNRTQNRTFG